MNLSFVRDTLRAAIPQRDAVIAVIVSIGVITANTFWPGSIQSIPLTGQSGGSSSSTGNPIDAPVLNGSYFTYLGGFAMPDSVPVGGGHNTASFTNGGFAMRRVNGELRFFATAHAYGGGRVYETNFPGLGTSTFPTASVVRAWGDIYKGRRCEMYNGVWTCALNSAMETHGLYYDEPTGRLYWNYGDWYDVQNYGGKPAFGYSVLNDSDGTSEGYGPWGLANANAHWTRGCTMAIPQWFADQFTGGKRIGVGCGGVGFSINAAASKGVALAAIDPPEPTTATGSPLPNVRLIGYPQNGVPYTQPDREHRSANYLQLNDGWAATGNTGYPTWMDGTGQICIMISDPAYQGLLCGRGRTEGRETYRQSTIVNEKYGFWWSVWDLKDLGQVALGSKNMWEIQPKYQWRDDVLSSAYGISHSRYAGGLAYDSVTKRIFVMTRSGIKIGCCGYPPVIRAFQIGVPTGLAIKQNPMPSQVFMGQTATFTVEAQNATSYQWQRSNDNGATWADIGGATGVSYSLTTALSDSDALFRVVVSGSGDTKTSASALLMVLNPNAPVIDQHPQDQTVAVGGTAQFPVVPVGSKKNYFYTWFKSMDGGVTWSNFYGNGSTFEDILVIPNVTEAMNGMRLRVDVTQQYANGNKKTTSNVAILTVGGGGGSSSSSSSSSFSSSSSSSSSSFSSSSSVSSSSLSSSSSSKSSSSSWSSSSVPRSSSSSSISSSSSSSSSSQPMMQLWITDPQEGATVSGIRNIIAESNTQIVHVQFRVDGANVGVPDISKPYSFSWDTTKVPNGSHTLDAFALVSSAGSPLWASPVRVTVSNQGAANQAPEAQAGADMTITLPETAPLNGVVKDDGLPDPPGVLLISWDKVSGPGSVVFQPMDTAKTTAAFSAEGTYVLKLTGDDGELMGSDTMTVIVKPKPPTNMPPSVSAGSDSTITLPSNLRLDGMAGDDGLPNPPGTVTTLWSKVSGPGTVTFANNREIATTASFSADGIYVLRLTGTDGALSAFDERTVVVKPEVANQAPILSAGDDQVITLPNGANLSGKFSDDGLPNPPGTVVPAWTKVSGPGSVAFSDPTELQTMAKFSAAGTYTLRITGTDGELLGTDDMVVTVKAASRNMPPKVDAGKDRKVMLASSYPATILLSGKATDDGLPNPPAKLGIAWSQVSGPYVDLTHPDSLQTYVTFKEVGTYVFRLHANDGEIQVSDDIVIGVHRYNMPPTVDAGPDQTVKLSTAAQMKGVVTDDGLPLPPQLTYIWSQITGPSKASFSNTNILDPLVKFRQTGVYVFRLRSNDGAKWGSDDMVVNVLRL